MAMIPTTRSSYGRGGTLKTVSQRENYDLGSTPSFWDDLRKMRSTMGGMRPSAAPPPFYFPDPSTRSGANAAGQGESLRQIPTFVKNMSGPNIVSGYTSAYAGDPGAVFHGYVPENAIMPGAAQPMGPMSSGRSPGQFEGDPFFADYRVGGQSDNDEDDRARGGR